MNVKSTLWAALLCTFFPLLFNFQQEIYKLHKLNPIINNPLPFSLQAVKQFIDLCNNLGTNYSTAAAATAAAAAASPSSSSSCSASAPASIGSSSQSNFHITINSNSNTNPNPNTASATQSTATARNALLIRRNITHTTAVKFLYARKFDIPRAVSLYEQHEQIRQREYLYNIDPDVEPLRSELQTGKFTILVS